MNKLTDYHLVPKKITEAQADVLGMPSQVYEKAVAHAAGWSVTGFMNRATSNNAPADTLPTPRLAMPLVSARINPDKLVKSSLTVPTEDRIEKLQPPFYIRWTRGLNYEEAFLCVEDGEPDMREFATVSYGMANLFKAGLEALALIEKEKSRG
jgi:hypothetical protein